MEYFLFFVWISIMCLLVYRVISARKALQKVLKNR